MLQKTFKPPDCSCKSSRKLLPSQTRPWQRSLGSALSTAADGSRLRVLTGLSQLCPLSSRALWQALCLPHLAVVRSSGPRLQGTFRPPRACHRLPPCAPRVLLPTLPRSRAPSPARAAARRIQAGAAQPAANLDTFKGPRLVRASVEELRGREGEGRSEVTASFPNPGGGGREKGNPLN